MYSAIFIIEIVLNLFNVKILIKGNPIKTFWNQNTKTASASWRNVFNAVYSLYYEVSVQLEEGEGIVVQWQETTEEETNIEIDMNSIPDSGSKLKFSVRAINSAGYFETVFGELFVPGSIG